MLSVLGMMFELTSAPNTTLSSAASPRVSVPPLKVVVPVTVKLPPTSTLISDIYQENKHEDNFLYLTYSSENTFG